MQEPRYTSANIWTRFCHHRIGLAALCVVIAFALIGIYAPFLASSKPLFVVYDGKPYFPLFRYLLYTGFYTKVLDIFFNWLMFTLPIALLAFVIFSKRWRLASILTFIALQSMGFAYFAFKHPSDPASSAILNDERHRALQKLQRENIFPSWNFELNFMTSYAKLNMLLRYQQRKEQQEQYRKNMATSLKSCRRCGRKNKMLSMLKKSRCMRFKHPIKYPIKKNPITFKNSLLLSMTARNGFLNKANNCTTKSCLYCLTTIGKMMPAANSS